MSYLRPKIPRLCRQGLFPQIVLGTISILLTSMSKNSSYFVAACFEGEEVVAQWPDDETRYLDAVVMKDLYPEDKTMRLQVLWDFSRTTCHKPGREEFCKIPYRQVRRRGGLAGGFTCFDEIYADNEVKETIANAIIPRESPDPIALRRPYQGDDPSGSDRSDSVDVVGIVVAIIVSASVLLLCMGYAMWYTSTKYDLFRSQVVPDPSHWAAEYDIPDFKQFMESRPPPKLQKRQPISDVARAYLPAQKKPAPPKRPKLFGNEETRLADERLRQISRVHFFGAGQNGGADFVRYPKSTPAFAARDMEVKSRVHGTSAYARRTVVRERGVHIPDADYYSTPEGRRMRQISVKRATEIAPPARSGSAPASRSRDAMASFDTTDRDEECFRPALQTLVAGIGAKKYTKATRYGQRNTVLDPTGFSDAFLTAGPPGPDEF
ncbi:unnamed protein product [Amoebophrya sp. A120]|nr:unnamed protein product [Amoebophrya sp. A120]|eukprot:GSA120T00011470001.1